MPEDNFWTSWCKGRLTEADATPSGLTSAHLHHPPHIFYRPDALPAAQPTASKHWRKLSVSVRCQNRNYCTDLQTMRPDDVHVQNFCYIFMWIVPKKLRVLCWFLEQASALCYEEFAFSLQNKVISFRNLTWNSGTLLVFSAFQSHGTVVNRAAENSTCCWHGAWDTFRAFRCVMC